MDFRVSCVVIMIYGIRLFFLFFLLFSPLRAEPPSFLLKDRIANLEAIVQECAGESLSAQLLELARAYYQDQNQEKAFSTFLFALSEVKPQKQEPSLEDKRLYEEALAIYLDPHAQSTRETASAILSKYQTIYKQHIGYSELGFLVAASYANTGQFTDFFEVFYRSYIVYPEHYLAHKTKAILHVKLMEQSCSSEAREQQKQKILTELTKAAQAFPKDHSLYKMMIAFSPQKQKAILINSVLKKIVDGTMVVPRMDIGFYVEEAVKEQQFDSAQQLLDKAREWYQFSRIINGAQEYLDQQKKRT